MTPPDLYPPDHPLFAWDVDRRLRTAPHGDPLPGRPVPVGNTTERWCVHCGAHQLASIIFPLPHAADCPALAREEDPAWDFADWRPGRFPTFRLHPHQRRLLDGERPLRLRLRPDRPPLPSWNEVCHRLTPGSLKLAGARIMASARGTDVAAEMARQIDFEWEERRWRVPAGDTAAVENGMGC